MILGPNSSQSLSDDEDDDDTVQSGLDGPWDSDHVEEMSFMDRESEHKADFTPKSPSAFKKAKSIKFGEDSDATIVHISCKGQH
jgi:hypothetical protein